jgi:hypothetical protein
MPQPTPAKKSGRKSVREFIQRMESMMKSLMNPYHTPYIKHSERLLENGQMQGFRNPEE